MLVTGPNEFFQACQRSLQGRLRVRGRLHFLCVSTVQNAEYGEIERDSGSSEELSSGSRRRRDSFAKMTPSKIGCFQGLWHWDQFTAKSVVTLTPNSKWIMRWRWIVTQRYLVCAVPNPGSDRQRWQRNLGSNSTQSAEGSRWDQILSESWKQKENRNRLPILVGL